MKKVIIIALIAVISILASCSNNVAVISPEINETGSTEPGKEILQLPDIKETAQDNKIENITDTDVESTTATEPESVVTTSETTVHAETDAATEPAPVEVNLVILETKQVDLTTGESYTFSPRVSPADVTDKRVTLLSNDTNIAVVNGFTVTAVGRGNTVVTVKSTNGTSAACRITVSGIDTEIYPAIQETINTFLLKPADKLLINELSTSNKTGPRATDGNRYDWIELYNGSGVTIDLSGWRLHLGDAAAEGFSPGNIKIEPGKIILVSASGEDTEGHIGFKLPREGGTVILTDDAGNITDSVTYPEMKNDMSYAKNGINNGGSASNGIDGYSATTLITPGYENNADGLDKYFLQTDSVSGPLVINEVMSSNNTYLEIKGEFNDWIELRNKSNTDINLKNFYITDSVSEPYKCQLPDMVLKPDQLFVILASGKDQRYDGKYYHVPFKIDADGETLFIYKTGDIISDSVYIYIPKADISYGRISGSAGFYYFNTPTPGSANKNGMRAITAAPCLSHKEGIYNNTEFLNISLTGDGDIYFTVDGSIPDRNSIKYNGTFSIRKTAVIRAISVCKGKLDSKITTACYILNENHTLPVINIAVNPADMWSEETGIYATGPNAADKYPFLGANYNQNWECPANVMFFDTDGSGFSIDCGIKISGAGSRTLPKKSFQLKFRSRYGKETLDYDIFENGIITSFKTLKLRVGEDYQLSVFRDELVTSVAGAGMPDVSVQAYRWCVLYINGEYFGLYCIREKLDEHYVAAHEKTETNGVSVLYDESYAEYGSAVDYNALLTYIRDNGVTDSNVYAYVKERVNLNSIIDWAIAEIYTGNRDLGNLRLCRAPQGKWKWMLYDMDWSFYNTERAYTLLISDSHAGRTRLLRMLLQNNDFRVLFIERVAYHMKSTFSAENVTAKIDELTVLLSPEITRERERWGSSYKMWLYYVDSMRNFIKTRPSEVIAQTIQFFNMTDEEVINYFK